jgi:N-acetylglucosaminyldiphosphoundecaprenol N-acetyl-beta-D-mannosaminyltransferase
MKNIETIHMMNYQIFTNRIKRIKIDFEKKDKMIINTLNAHSYITAKEDPIFKKALHASDILIPDGSGIVLAVKKIKKKSLKKFSGADVHEELLEILNKSNGKCFYMGAGENTLLKIKNRLKKEYPNIKAKFYSPPYRDKFSDDENREMIDAVNLFKPDVLFVGMTAPKQEKWIYLNNDLIDAKVFCAIGAVFDFYAGNVTRPSQFWIDIHMEWFPRFLKEPRKLWRRNLISMPLFLLDIMLYRLKFKRK